MGGRVLSLNQSAAVFQIQNVYTEPIFKNVHHIIGQITQKTYIHHQKHSTPQYKANCCRTSRGLQQI